MLGVHERVVVGDVVVARHVDEVDRAEAVHAGAHHPLPVVARRGVDEDGLAPGGALVAGGANVDVARAHDPVLAAAPGSVEAAVARAAGVVHGEVHDGAMAEADVGEAGHRREGERLLEQAEGAAVVRAGGEVDLVGRVEAAQPGVDAAAAVHDDAGFARAQPVARRLRRVGEIDWRFCGAAAWLVGHQHRDGLHRGSDLVPQREDGASRWAGAHAHVVVEDRCPGVAHVKDMDVGESAAAIVAHGEQLQAAVGRDGGAQHRVVDDREADGVVLVHLEGVEQRAILVEGQDRVGDALPAEQQIGRAALAGHAADDGGVPGLAAVEGDLADRPDAGRRRRVVVL